MTDWAVKYQPQRDRYWLEVDAFFNGLPPHLYQQGVLLKNNLATFYADTGQFKDILRRPHDPPFLYLHFWLLDDFHFPDTVQRSNLEQYLFLAMIFIFASIYTRETILDEGSNFDNRYLLLEKSLIQQAGICLAQIYAPPARFWHYHRTFWNEYADAVLAELDPQSAQVATTGQPSAAKLAFAKIPVAAVGLAARQSLETINRLCGMLDQLNCVLQTLRDIAAVRTDIARRHYTYPIIRTMQAAKIDLQQPISPEQLLGALVLTGVIKKIGQESLAQLENCRTVAEALNLPSFIIYFAEVESAVHQIIELFSINTRANPVDSQLKLKPNSIGPFFVPHVETAPKVIEMAERYLLSDLTFKESWEIQRRGLFDLPKITGQAFPTGLITELLCQHGHPMTGPIDTIFQTLQGTGFRYYDHPHLPPDTDDLGLLLRLFPYSTQRKKHNEIMQKPLGWLHQNISANGRIPVWLVQNDLPQSQDFPHTALWGHNCVAVEANILLGLIDYDWPRYEQIIERSTSSLAEQFCARGFSAAHHYVPLYTLWVLLRLTTRLLDKQIRPELESKLNLVNQSLAEFIAREINRPYLSPQDAAFLSLICLVESAPSSIKSGFSSAWVTLLSKHQRYDGSWLAEPLYGTPTRGEYAAWYASNLITTAFCYHALKTYETQSI